MEVSPNVLRNFVETEVTTLSFLRIEIGEGDVFSLTNDSEKGSQEGIKRRKSEAASEKNEAVRGGTVFRPFGVLEPSSARAARRNIADALQLFSELASFMTEFFRVHKVYDHSRS